MGLNQTQFMKQAFEPRVETLSVSALAEWFDADSPAEWTVRNLTGSEMSSAQEAAAKNKNVAALAEALITSGQNEKVLALRKIIGTSNDVPDELAKRLEMLVFASVEPVIDMSLAIKMAENFPIEFMQLTNKITILTGMGASKAKPKPSGKIPPLGDA